MLSFLLLLLVSLTKSSIAAYIGLSDGKKFNNIRFPLESDNFHYYLFISNFELRLFLSELRFIHQEMGSLRDENLKQNLEISNLKATVQLQNTTITKHETTIKELITGNHKMIRNGPPVALSRHKRPAQLIPTSISIMVSWKMQTLLMNQIQSSSTGHQPAALS